MIKNVYTDGGIIYSGKPGESTIGGTWANCFINEKDEVEEEETGFYKSLEGNTTNNHTEFLSVLYALEKLPNNWNGNIYTDSMVTIFRIRKRNGGENLPQEYVDRLCKSLDRLGIIDFIHVKGHANKKEIANGETIKGRLTSKWNKHCDDLCNELKLDYTAICAIIKNNNGVIPMLKDKANMENKKKYNKLISFYNLNH